jgi:hypothetical protein
MTRTVIRLTNAKIEPLIFFEVKIEVEVNLLQNVSRPVCLCIGLPTGAHDQICFSWKLRVSWRGAPSLMRELICSLLWALLEQSLSGPSPTELMTIFYYLIWGTPDLEGQVLVFIWYPPPGKGWPSYTPGHWVPFRRHLRLAGLRWSYSNPPLTPKSMWKVCLSCLIRTLYIALSRAE